MLTSSFCVLVLHSRSVELPEAADSQSAVRGQRSDKQWCVCGLFCSPGGKVSGVVFEFGLAEMHGLSRPLFVCSGNTDCCTVWCSEIGSLTSLDACNSGASSDVREPISLHQAVLD